MKKTFAVLLILFGVSFGIGAVAGGMDACHDDLMELSATSSENTVRGILKKYDFDSEKRRHYAIIKNGGEKYPMQNGW